MEAQLAALEASAAADPALVAEDDSHIAAWHAAYRAFGTNPRRRRPCADSLRRPRSGEPGAVEHPHPGKVIYADGAGVLTRRLFHEIAAADPDILALVPEWESGPGVDVDLRSGT